MVHLLQLFTTLLLLSHAKLGGAELKVVPASFNIWNIIGDKINFFNRVLKTAITPECKQTDHCTPKETSDQPLQTETKADLPNTTGFQSSASTHDLYVTGSGVTTPESLSIFTSTTTENTEAVFTDASKNSSTPATTSAVLTITEASSTGSFLDDATANSDRIEQENKSVVTELINESMQTTAFTVESMESTEPTNKSVDTTESTTASMETTELDDDSMESSSESEEDTKFTNGSMETTELTKVSTESSKSTSDSEETTKFTNESMETTERDDEGMESSESTSNSEKTTDLTSGSMQTTEPTSKSTETTELTNESVETSESTSEGEKATELPTEGIESSEPTSKSTETTELPNERVETSESTSEGEKTTEVTNGSVEATELISTEATMETPETISDNATADTTKSAVTTASAPNTTTQVTRDINGADISATTSFYESAEQCNKAAHFDDEKGVCVCNNPEMDGKKRNPIKYYEYSEGDVCYSCQDPNSTTAVVFILDEGGVVKESGWNAQKKFMQRVLDLMGDIQVGIVVIAGNSYVAVPLDDYGKNKEAIDDFVRTKAWGNKWTSTGVALYRARKMLEDSTADRKNIIIFSDGDKDACYYDDPTEDCPQWKKDNILAHPQEDEARAIHEMGIKVTFVAVNFRRSSSRILKIAGKPKNIVKIRTFTDFNSRALNGVINLVCKAEELKEE